MVTNYFKKIYFLGCQIIHPHLKTARCVKKSKLRTVLRQNKIKNHSCG